MQDLTKWIVPLLLGLALLAACGGGSGGGGDDDPSDLPPTITILEPSDGSVFDEGTLITFRGRGTDPEDGDLPDTVLTWTSDIDGPFGIGPLVRKDDLSYGVHGITLRGIDSGTNFVTETIEVTVLAPLRAITSPGDLVITEAQVDPGPVAGVDGEWFEIHNPTEFRLDIATLTIRDAGTDFHQVPTSIVLDPGEFFVFGRTRDGVTNGGATVDYAYGATFTLANDLDAIIIQMGSTTIDRVDYDATTWPVQTGISMSLSEEALADDLNDLPENWCGPLAIYGSVGLRGTPSEPNPICAP